MEDSILKSVKKKVRLDPEYTAFDLDIITFINSTLFKLHQLGIGPGAGFMVEDDSELWTDFMPRGSALNAVKTYVYLNVSLLFDPPETSFTQEAMKAQLTELEWRLHLDREATVYPAAEIPPSVVVIDGGQI